MKVTEEMFINGILTEIEFDLIMKGDNVNAGKLNKLYNMIMKHTLYEIPFDEM